MVQQFVSEIERSFSQPRLEKYGSPGTPRSDLIVSYFWNLAISEALVSPLAIVEVALRNAIDQNLSILFNRADWQLESGFLHYKQLREYANAIGKVEESHAVLTPGKIIAELNFGFWTSMLHSGYHHKAWNHNQGSVLRATFPGKPAQTQRSDIYDQFTRIRLLRNRVMHHEPIANGIRVSAQRRQNAGTWPISVVHDQILQTIGWLNPTLAATTARVETFDALIREQANWIATFKSDHGLP